MYRVYPVIITLIVLCITLVSACKTGKSAEKPGVIHLRSEPMIISDDQKSNEKAKQVFNVKEVTFEIVQYDVQTEYRNNVWLPLAYTKNNFEVKNDVVIDYTTELMWQKSSSPNKMTYQDAQAYIIKLNQERIGGHSDWRLPTVNELLSLMTQNSQFTDKGVYISLIFDKTQRNFDTTQLCFWSADKSSSTSAWHVSFGRVDVRYDIFDFKYYVRAVRSCSLDDLKANATPTPVLTVNRASVGKTWTDPITGMEFVLIPAGEFMMGTAVPQSNCPEDDPFTEKNERKDCLSQVKIPKNETPIHRVIISEPFYIGKYEVTQLQWYKVMGNNPASFKTEKVGMDSQNHPVEQVSWKNAQEFIRRLNEKAGMTRYRLPTEAEWEYVCRAGTTTTYNFGDDENQIGQYAWYVGNSGHKTHPVGQLQPNTWGVYDIHGNVEEWIQDWYSETYYAKSPSTDPQGPPEGGGFSYSVLRGGLWNDEPSELSCAKRDFGATTLEHSDYYGLRVVVTSKTQ